MKGIVFIIALVVVLAIFGVPVLCCFMGILVVGLGVGVEAAMPLAMILTVAMVAGIGISHFLSMTDFAEHMEYEIGSAVLRVK